MVKVSSWILVRLYAEIFTTIPTTQWTKKKKIFLPKKDFILVESPYLLHTLSLKHKRQPNLHWESISERRLLYSGSLIVTL